jgi:hypothetical protein
MSKLGLKLGLRYSFWPNQFGFCGPQGKSAKAAFLDFLTDQKVSEKKIIKLMQSFKGAVPYYKLIARSNSIKDYFDEKVVAAYWIGNQLLDKVSVGSLRKMIIKDFSGPGLLNKKIALKKAQSIPDRSRPHHSFHVLIIGSVTGTVNLRGKLLDVCRVGWGRVVDLRQKDKLVVRYQPLVGKKKLTLGRPIKKKILRDKRLVSKIKIGDWVSFHWGYLIQKLSAQEVKNLRKYTQITLKGLNL